MSRTTIESSGVRGGAELSRTMDIALGAVTEICETMFMIDLSPTDGVEFDPDALAFAGCVTLLHNGGSWALGLYGTKEGGENLAREISGLSAEDEIEPDTVVDALGEIANMVAGTVKTKLGSQIHGDIHITAPLFLTGKYCRQHIPVAMRIESASFTSSSFDGHLFFTWIERTPATLLEEIDALLDTCASGDKMGLTQVISLFQEFEDALQENVENLVADHVADCVADCETVLTDMVNGDADLDANIDWLRQVVGALTRAVLGMGGEAALARLPKRPGRASPASTPPPIERDKETLEMLADFLQEAADGLETAEQVLMSLEEDPGNDVPDAIDQLLRIYHTIKGVAGFLECSDVARLAHTTETLLAKVRDGCCALGAGIVDLVLESTSMIRALLGNVRRAAESGTAIAEHPPLDDLTVRLLAAVRGEEIPAPPRPGADGQPTDQAFALSKSKIKEILKIDATLVADLEDVVSQFGRVEPLISAAKAQLPDADLTAAIDELHLLFGRFKSVSARMRMVSLASVFQKMTRMVRDLAKKTEKLAKMVVEGQDTLVPRGMIDKISDLLVHLVRNAVDHGIEDPDERLASGKPMLAAVRLAARHENDHVVVEISEDGRGLDATKLIARAAEKGLIEPGAELSQQEAFQLIFKPGFSTAEQVTAISGRGVGMDVVSRNVEAMSGTLAIDSELGAGTTFRFVVPLLTS